MVFIATGFTFSTGVQDQGTAAALGTFVSNAGVTSITLAEFRSTAHVTQVSATTPASNQGEGSLWFDSTLNILRQLDGTRWDCEYEGAEMQNNTGATIPLGAWVYASANNAISQVANSALPEVLGCLTATATNTSKAIVRRTGYAPARLTGPIVYGDILVSAHTSDAFGGSGYAKAATMISGYGNTSFTGGIELGMALGAVAASTTGLVTCLMWR